jgi:hypothetical protein
MARLAAVEVAARYTLAVEAEAMRRRAFMARSAGRDGVADAYDARAEALEEEAGMDAVPVEVRQYGVPKGGVEATAFQKVEAALWAVGLRPGSYARSTQIVGYRPGQVGYVIESSKYLNWPLDGETRVYVDHAGPGRTDALARYCAVLVAAGFAAELRQKPMRQRTVVVVDGLF